MRFIVGAISVLGMLVFGLAFAVSFVQPVRIEAFAQDLLQREVAARAAASLQAAERTQVGQFVRRMAEQHPEQAEAVRRQLRERLVPYVEAVIVEMRDPDCPCRRKLATLLEFDAASGLIDQLRSGGERLTAFVRTKYLDAAAALLREFRIFTGANALMFALLGLVVVRYRGARAHLLPAAIALPGAALIVAALYLFAQNWLHTIVFGDYVGWAYFAYLGVAGALLGDLLLNRGRLSARVVGSTGGILASAPVSPC